MQPGALFGGGGVNVLDRGHVGARKYNRYYCDACIELREYCFPNSFNASCGPDSVVVMAKARYGRINSGSKCLASEYKVGCWADVLHHLDRRCSGRRHCAIAIPDNTMHLLQPCQKDLFAYLEADYVCQKGSYCRASDFAK